jgi:hypothetical protein
MVTALFWIIYSENRFLKGELSQLVSREERVLDGNGSSGVLVRVQFEVIPCGKLETFRRARGGVRARRRRLPVDVEIASVFFESYVPISCVVGSFEEAHVHHVEPAFRDRYLI